MTADRAALVEKVAQLLIEKYGASYEERATAAIDLIRAEVLEEAARVADEHLAWDTAAAIRALKDGN
jgi:hypothetical protein